MSKRDIPPEEAAQRRDEIDTQELEAFGKRLPRRHKRSHGEGTIYEDKKRGQWHAQVTLPYGKRKSIYGDTKRETQEKMNALKAEIAAGLHNTRDAETPFGTFAQHWLIQHQDRLSLNTQRDYEVIARVHMEDIAHIPLNRLTAAIMRAHYTKKRETLAPSTVATHHRFFHVVLEDAVSLDILPKNPADKAAIPFTYSTRSVALSSDQVALFFQAIEGHRYKAAFIIGVSNGLRSGEIRGLTWGDIDWQGRRMSMRHNLYKHTKKKGGHYTLMEPKNESRRIIPLPDYTHAALAEHYLIQQEEKAELGGYWANEWDLIFTTPTGHPVHSDSLLLAFRKVLLTCGINPKTRIHDLRHSFATLLLENGVDSKVVSEWLGHASVTVTDTIYKHVTPKMRGSALATLNQLLPAPREIIDATIEEDGD